ncbi:MAG TPA: ATP synthase subunit I [Acidobacteriaceae bacterium]|nr:ATP synthase subunit I [Acidobacteriaceae bacterium]
MSPDPATSAGQMTDADLENLLRRALRTVIVAGVALALVFTFTMGWQSGLLELAGAAISYTGIREWRTLSRLVSATMDNQKPQRPMGRTLVLFFVRLGFVGVILYVSLRCLHGSVYALIAGIGLAIAALSIEAFRLLRT